MLSIATANLIIDQIRITNEHPNTQTTNGCLLHGNHLERWQFILLQFRNELPSDMDSYASPNVHAGPPTRRSAHLNPTGSCVLAAISGFLAVHTRLQRRTCLCATHSFAPATTAVVRYFRSPPPSQLPNNSSRSRSLASTVPSLDRLVRPHC